MRFKTLLKKKGLFMDYLLQMQKDLEEHPLTVMMLKEHFKNPCLSDAELAINIMSKYEDTVKEFSLDQINGDFELFNKLSSEQREAFKEIMWRLQENIIVTGEYKLNKD